MARVARGEAERRSEAGDRTRLAVVAREHDRAGALGRREPVPHTSDGRGQGGPADRLDRVLVDRRDRRRVQIADGHERERDRSRDSGRDTDHDPEPEAASSSRRRAVARRRRLRRRAARAAGPSCSTASPPATKTTTSMVRYARPSGRYGRASVRRRSHQSPASQRAARSGPISSSCRGRSPTRLPIGSSLPISSASSSCGQPWCACQRRFGTQRRSASAAPAQSQRAAREARGGGRAGSRRRGRPTQEQHEILVLEPEADDQADEQPLPLVPAAEDAGHEQHHRDPDENIERRRREQMADRHRCAGGCSRERGHGLTCAACTELPGDERDEHDDDRDRDGRHDAQTTGVFAEGRFRQPAEQGRQRRLIVVPPGRVPRGDAEVELVAVVAVAVRGRDEQRQLGRSDGKNERPRDGGPATIHYEWRLFPTTSTAAQPLSSRAAATACASMWACSWPVTAARKCSRSRA